MTESLWEQIKQAGRDGLDKGKARQERNRELIAGANAMSLNDLHDHLSYNIGRELEAALSNERSDFSGASDFRCGTTLDMIESLMDDWKVLRAEYERRKGRR